MKIVFPKRLQAVLWSANINNLDLEKDQTYIIHQIFSHGRIEDILWLFKTYSREKLNEVFTKHPYKDYRPARFNFIKNYILSIKNKTLDDQYYVRNTPRNIR